MKVFNQRWQRKHRSNGLEGNILTIGEIRAWQFDMTARRGNALEVFADQAKLRDMHTPSFIPFTPSVYEFTPSVTEFTPALVGVTRGPTFLTSKSAL